MDINNKTYNVTSRTLCPFLCGEKSEISNKPPEFVVVSISTVSQKIITFELELNLFPEYYLRYLTFYRFTGIVPILSHLVNYYNHFLKFLQ